MANAPDRLTISTCIGCGAMTVPGGCAGGCGPERKLELVQASELDELIDLEHQAGARARALAEVLERFLALPHGELPQERHGLMREVLRSHDHNFPTATAALANVPDPIVSWWCERCGAVDAPAPCIGVCVRRPAQWASLAALERQRTATAARLADEQQLALAVRALALTHPRPGREPQHWQGLRNMTAAALASHQRDSYEWM